MYTKLNHKVKNGDEYEIAMDDTSIVLYLEAIGYRIEVNHYEDDDNPTVLVYRDSKEVDRLIWELTP
jgi:hypothetical protein